MNSKKLLKLIFFLCIIGVLLASYLTYLHYSHVDSPCDLSETFQCSKVNRSEHAEFFGIPVALLGLGGYLLIAFMSLSIWKGFNLKKFKLNKLINKNTLFSFSLIAVAFSLYLTYAEIFLIKALCLLCIISQIIVIIIAILAYLIKRGD